MYVPFSSWGSPVGIGIFFIGLGIFFWGFLSGIAAVTRVKHFTESRKQGRDI